MEKPLAFIVEDDPKLNRIFCLSLERDFQVQSCDDGNEAIRRLGEITPLLAILDLNLPGKSGAEILKFIRSTERLAKVRVILATADERQAETLERDADLVLLKPVSPMQLRDLAARFKPQGG
jgi:DNA-binding response OmpR family regulator